MSDDVPDYAKVWLELDVAQFLHEEADLHYDGDVSVALNTIMRAVIKLSQNPEDPWAFIDKRMRTRRS